MDEVVEAIDMWRETGVGGAMCSECRSSRLSSMVVLVESMRH